MSVLPNDRKLLWLRQRNVETAPKRSELIQWAGEDQLKSKFAEFVEALGSAVKDNVDHLKRTAMRCALGLLTKKPEQEAALLYLLVDKLGDPERTIASYASHLLGTLLKEHPRMKVLCAARCSHVCD